MKYRILIYLSALLLIPFLGLSQSVKLSSNNDTLQHPFKFGLEYDLMAPRIGKWNSVNLSAYMNKGRFQHSLIFVHININNRHLTDESFKKDDLNALGYRFEIYSSEKMKKWSVGLMVMYSMNNVVTSLNSQSGHFNTLIVGVPLGYTWLICNHLTIKPSLNILYPLTNKTVTIGTDQVSQAPWGLEPGIRIGYRF
jgi:hypothetical protein